MIENGGIPQKEFEHIAAMLGNFIERYQRTVPNGPHTELAQKIQDAANAKVKGAIKLTRSVHTHPPYAATTVWFTFMLNDTHDQPREFHIFVDPDLWAEKLLMNRRLDHNAEPQVPQSEGQVIGSFFDPLRQESLTWFK